MWESFVDKLVDSKSFWVKAGDVKLGARTSKQILLFESVFDISKKNSLLGIWFGSIMQYLCGDFPSDFFLF